MEPTGLLWLQIHKLIYDVHLVVTSGGGWRRTTGKEGGEGLVGRGNREGEGELGVVLTGTSGVQKRYACAGKKPTRSLYMAMWAERAQGIHGRTRGERPQVYYKERNGARVLYQQKGHRSTMLPRGACRKRPGGSPVAKMGVRHIGGQHVCLFACLFVHGPREP